MRRLAVLLSVALNSVAQQPAFRAETRVVQIPVSVTDALGKSIEGLSARDFMVRDDSLLRSVTLDVFGSGAAPISLVIAIQTSGLSNPALQKIRRIGSLIQPLVIGHRGEAAVLTFDYAIQWRQGFSKETTLIQRAVAALEPAEYKQARLFDAVIEAVSRLKERPGRRVLLLISEARDKGSKAKLEGALEAVAREGVEVFAAPYSVAAAGLQDEVGAMTEATGGSQYPFAKQRTAEKAIENLGAELHSQYILSLPQGTARPGPHRIEVSVPGHPSARILARRTYWAD